MSLPPDILEFIKSDIFQDFLENWEQPIAIVNSDDKIIWQNELFSNLFNLEINNNYNTENSIISGLNLHTINFSNFKLVFQNKSTIFISEIKAVVHDFNNILYTIINSAELLRKKLEASNPELLYLLENIEQSTEKASEMIEMIIPKKNPVNNKKIVNISRLLYELKNALQQTFPKNIKIVFEIESNLPKVKVNKTDIYRSLLNIAINAKEAINNDGIIKFSVDKTSLTNNKTSNNTDYIQIKIFNNGKIIPEEIIDKIFYENFSTKKKKLASGMGLHNVKKIITEHGGFISVKSNQTLGTIFTILLPCIDERLIQPQNTETKTILIADDDKIIRDLLSELLESAGFNSIQANNGKEVLEKIEQTNISLLIIDKKMPVMNGIECISEIRKRNIKTPIILASGSSVDNENQEQLLKLGINSILNKPYNFNQIIFEITKLIGQ